jgi:hypothetical protein
MYSPITPMESNWMPPKKDTDDARKAKPGTVAPVRSRCTTTYMRIRRLTQQLITPKILDNLNGQVVKFRIRYIACLISRLDV